MEAAVVALPHEILGEEPAAVIQIKEEFIGKVTEAELKQFCATRLAPFQCPVFYDLRTTELPYNQARKVLKRELREEVTKLAKERGFLKSTEAKL